MTTIQERPTICPRCGSETTEPEADSLRAVRQASGLTMGDVARQLDLSTPYVSDIERGRRRATPVVLEFYRGLDRGAKSLARVKEELGRRPIHRAKADDPGGGGDRSRRAGEGER